MSFFSGLQVFYPGRPPRPTLGELRKFCDGLRTTLAVRDDRLLRVELQYGANDAETFDAAHEVKWDASGTVGRLPLEEERQSDGLHHERHAAAWNTLWPGINLDGQPILRASVHLGSLSEAASEDLRAVHPDGSARSYIVPDGLSVSISPVYAMTLATEPPEDEDECYGFLGLSFHGNGYFTWQPLEAYWRVAGHTATVRKTLQLCREIWPVPELGGLEALHEALGERFLNRADYQPGDWIVSVSESG